MRHGKTAFQNWQLAGCPTIPAGRFNPWIGYWQAKANKAAAIREAQERLDAYSKQMAQGAQKGLLARAASAVGRFLQRRRA